ncbi:phosphatase PAP2 family protein [Mesonia sp. HuA40]|uniref:phosphatase PAP2 family protein n=1 Tax=Mesonia sp. HuA40 TaxID=2602761 RepID=UPI0011CB60BC|nr:phosphatase PAP2 family protein [Mesonia sp. HuA40]TXK73536.1 phosphatase PAP2 family protein [Mesonia sp. HuA40]
MPTIEQLLQWDQELFLYLNNLGTPVWDWFWVFITHKFAAIPMYAYLLYLLYKNYNLKTLGITLVFIALLITATDQLANVFKDAFARPRPCKEDFMAQGRFLMDYCGKYGYFSAHAASSTALAIFLGNILKKWYKSAFPLLLIWAMLVSYSRIYVGKHYPGDVITGILIGSLIGFLFYKLHQISINKLNAKA